MDYEYHELAGVDDAVVIPHAHINELFASTEKDDKPLAKEPFHRSIGGLRQ